MAAVGKTPRRTVRAMRGAKRTGAKRHPVNPSRHPAKPIPTTTVPAEPPGFPIVGIGASAGWLEAMEESFRHMSMAQGRTDEARKEG